MKPRFSNPAIIPFLLFATVALAESDLDRLKSSYESAAAKAVQPLKVTYEKELRSLLQRYTQEGSPNDVAKVKAELKAIGITDPAPSRASSSQLSPERPQSKQRLLFEAVDIWDHRATICRALTGNGFEFIDRLNKDEVNSPDTVTITIEANWEAAQYLGLAGTRCRLPQFTVTMKDKNRVFWTKIMPRPSAPAQIRNESDFINAINQHIGEWFKANVMPPTE